jgi:hypothetical protein
MGMSLPLDEESDSSPKDDDEEESPRMVLLFAGVVSRVFDEASVGIRSRSCILGLEGCSSS